MSVAPRKSAAAPAAAAVGKAAQVKKVASAKKAAKVVADAAAAAPKQKKEKKGLLASRSKFHRDLHSVWVGKVSSDAPLVVGSFLQFLNKEIQVHSVRTAFAEDPHARVTAAHMQGALTALPWLSRSGLVTGRVSGAAPMMFQVAE